MEGGVLAQAVEIVRDPKVVDATAYRNASSAMMPVREALGGLFYAYPLETIDMKASSGFTDAEVGVHEGLHGLMMMHPDGDPVEVKAAEVRHRAAGVKVYFILQWLCGRIWVGSRFNYS